MNDIIRMVKLDILASSPYYTLKNLIILVGLSLFYNPISGNIYMGFGISLLFAILYSIQPFLWEKILALMLCMCTLELKRKRL